MGTWSAFSRPLLLSSDQGALGSVTGNEVKNQAKDYNFHQSVARVKNRGPMKPDFLITLGTELKTLILSYSSSLFFFNSFLF